MRDSPSIDEDFTTFVAARSAALYRSAWLLTTSAPVAEDLVQSALAKAYVHWRKVQAADDPDASDDGDISCPGNLAPRAQCTELFAADGTTLIGRRSSTIFGEVTTLEDVLRRNGGTVYVATANTLDDKWGRTSPASAEQPPLTPGQLEDLVRNDTWVMPAT